MGEIREFRCSRYNRERIVSVGSEVGEREGKIGYEGFFW